MEHDRTTLEDDLKALGPGMESLKVENETNSTFREKPTQLEYEALPTSTSIRLLVFDQESNKDSTISPTANLTATLQIFDLEDTPKFQALSYTWGTPYREVFGDDCELAPEFTSSISCNGTPVAITQNLYDALSTFRGMDITGWLWIDALCINQSDAAERSLQVLMMGDIYSAAYEVLAWLGPPKDGIKDLLWATTEFLDIIQDGEIPAEAKAIFSLENMRDEEFWVQFGIEYPLERLIKFAFYYRSCRWFSRAWVLQEMALGARGGGVRMFCGETEVSFQRALDISIILSYLGWRNEISTEIAIRSGGKYFPWLIELATSDALIKVNTDPYWSRQELWKVGARPVWTLGWMIFFSRMSACQDPRDKIYSLLGIINSHFPPAGDSVVAKSITPDYTISAENLYTRVTTLILNHSKYLDYISDTRRHSHTNSNDAKNETEEVDGTSNSALRSGSNQSLQLPSWVLDYSSSIESFSTVSIGCSATNFDAALCQTSEHPKFIVTDDTISCYGAQFDTVQDIEDCVLLDCLLASETALLAHYQFFLTLPHLIRGRRRFEVLWRTMLINRVNLTGPETPPDSFEKLAVMWMKTELAELNCRITNPTQRLEFNQIIAQLENHDTPEGERETVREWKREALDSEGESTEEMLHKNSKRMRLIGPYTSIMAHVSTGRRLFKTKRGLLGTGLASVRKGDQVWLLCDSRVPFLLRETEEASSFSVVGGCYTHDFMYGQMLDDEWGVKAKIGAITLV